ncbi:MAG: hypothetical protein ABII71_02300 [Candidatus Micrarchaeota archaeon]
MAKKKARSSPSRSSKQVKIASSELQKIEKQTLEKTNKAISAIENAIAVWDASEKKPIDIKIRINRLRYFHQALSNWEKKMLSDIASQSEYTERVQRLCEFSDICRTYRRG